MEENNNLEKMIRSLDARLAMLEGKLSCLAFDVESWASEVIMIERALDNLKYDLDMKERSSSKPARMVEHKNQMLLK